MKSYISALLGICLLAQTSCTKNFVTENTNPDAVSTPTAEFVFTKALYDGMGNTSGIYGGSTMYLLQGTMQYTTSYNDVAGFGSKYVAAQVQQTYATFNAAYPDEINELGIVIRSLKSDPAKVNMLAAARIWRVFCFSRVTDLYGDIPYFKAGLGYDSSLYKPVYDAQKDIYADMLSELDAAAQSFDGAKATYGAADLIYNGNIGQWKKFAYSLMLRLAMRMTKVDIASAQSWATKAIAGGVITLDVDIAKMPYLGSGQQINQNPMAYELWNADYIAKNGVDNAEGGKYQDVWINYLKSTNDPRLPIISIVYNNGVADTSVGIQKGMPATIPYTKPADFVTYSEPNPKTVLLLSSNQLVFSAAESYFLLTEAALRGWYSGSTAAALYTLGVQAALRNWSIIAGAAGTINPAAVTDYVAANQLNTGGTFDQQMQQIYTQFWVSIFPDATEAYSSYRRTGYPALVGNNYTGNATGGQIFRRCLYPISEQTLNGDALKAAIARQGADDLMTHIWWDK